MERIEFFAEEIDVRNQKVREARLLVRAPGRLLVEVEKIVKAELKKTERTTLDFV